MYSTLCWELQDFTLLWTPPLNMGLFRAFMTWYVLLDQIQAHRQIAKESSEPNYLHPLEMTLFENISWNPETERAFFFEEEIAILTQNKIKRKNIHGDHSKECYIKTHPKYAHMRYNDSY